MRIVFFGTPQFAVPCLQNVLNVPDFEVVAVVTQPDKRRGRGSSTTPSPVKKLALEHQLSIWQPTRIKKDAETLDRLAATEADIFAVVAYGQILSAQILAMPRLGCINVHGSLLPAYRGAAPIQWCLHNGERQTGITTMLMDQGMDTGAMLLKRSLAISLVENAQTLAEKLAMLGADLLVETMVKWANGEVQAIPQEHTLATYAPLLQKENFALKWSNSALALHNQIRGFFPNCFTLFRAQPLKVLSTIPIDISLPGELPETFGTVAQQWQRLDPSQKLAPHEPGKIIGLLKGQGPVIQAGEGSLVLTQVQPAGKRSQSGWDFVNGARVSLGEQCGEQCDDTQQCDHLQQSH